MKLVSNFYCTTEPLRELTRRLAADPRARALDVGCKSGDVARSLAAEVHELVALDPVRHADWALPGHPARFVQGDAMALPFRDGEFDLVVASESLQYVRDPAKALDEFHRVLRDGGRLLLSFPEGGLVATHLDPYNLTGACKRLIGARPFHGYTRHLDARDLLAQCGRRWSCIRRLRRGSIAFIYAAWAIDKLQYLRLMLVSGGPLRRLLAEGGLKPLIRLGFLVMRIDFRLSWAGLSYNNVILLGKCADPASSRE